MMAPDLPTDGWRKSSYSGNASNCVEVAFLDADWRKSSYSTSTANCVEVAFAGPAVGIRDSKDPDGPALVVSAAAFDDFLGLVRSGALDLTTLAAP